MTIKVTERTEEIIKFVKSRMGDISNVRAVDFLATNYLEHLFIIYQDSKIEKDDEWRMNAKNEFFEFLEKINYKPLG
jgi:hypothetical protein